MRSRQKLSAASETGFSASGSLIMRNGKTEINGLEFTADRGFFCRSQAQDTEWPDSFTTMRQIGFQRIPRRILIFILHFRSPNGSSG